MIFASWRAIHSGLCWVAGRFRYDLCQLAGDPFRALLGGRPLPLEEDERCGVTCAVGERLPAFDFGTFAVGSGHQFVVRSDVVKVLDDDARIKQDGVVVEDEDRNLAERIDVGHLVFRRPRRVDLEVVVDLFLSQDDPRLADVGTGK
ncbi:MAG: hypothetical protein AW07_02081 [Candidatus Accumulibacter sp. SK-11]|nr:MAG: hypothetical protein AW07_02081 [Candidatus Accumulibacter sp. SK-11]